MNESHHLLIAKIRRGGGILLRKGGFMNTSRGMFVRGGQKKGRMKGESFSA